MKTPIFVFNLMSWLLVVHFLGCSQNRPEGATQAEVLYKEAKAYVEDERYLLATERLNLLRSKHPYSYFATPAELLQADVLFAQENYVEAAGAYQIFRDLHPRHEQKEYVLWRLAESFYLQLPSTIDRDLNPAYDALKLYQELIQNYPASKYLADANNRIQLIKDKLMDKIEYIARFYSRTDHHASSSRRYQQLATELLSESGETAESRRSSAIRLAIENAILAKKYEQCLFLLNEFQIFIQDEAFHRENLSLCQLQLVELGRQYGP